MKIAAVAMMMAAALLAATVMAAVSPAGQQHFLPLRAHAATDGSVTVSGSSGALDNSGMYRVVGELKNEGPGLAANARVTVTFLDPAGAQVATASGDAYIRLLRQGEKSPFAVTLADGKQSARAAGYRIDVEWDAAWAQKEATLQVRITDSYYDASGQYHLVGQVANTGLRGSTDVVVAGAFYDGAGRVVGADAAFTSPAKIGAGHTAPFHFVYAHPTAGNSRIASASVNAQSDEFSSITAEEERGTVPQPAAEGKSVPRVSVSLDSRSYRFADEIRFVGNSSSIVAGESVVTVEFLYPDGRLLNSIEVPLNRVRVFEGRYDIYAGPEYEGKEFTVRATYAGGAGTVTFAYVGKAAAGAVVAPPAPAVQPPPAAGGEGEKSYSAKLGMIATMSEKTKAITLSLKNPNGSDAPVYGLEVKIDKVKISSAAGPTGWKAKISQDGDSVTFTTDSSPVKAGKTAKFKITFAQSSGVRSLAWDALDRDGDIINSKVTAVRPRK
ncbi:FxLYD domain-containing protein [Nitrososphaera sp.]|uniref:FxLYD domain-containing protein n=1 Tax=Nitrososphaera sp. TaxID=1971748 RepID=UPI00307F7290